MQYLGFEVVLLVIAIPSASLAFAEYLAEVDLRDLQSHWKRLGTAGSKLHFLETVVPKAAGFLRAKTVGIGEA